MRTKLLDLHTGGSESITDITDMCRDFVAEGGGDGLLNVFVPHATAGVTIMELGAGSDEDLLALLGDLLPKDDRWRHRHGSRGHGRDHVIPALIPSQTMVPVVSGRLELGTWQSVALVDTNIDNPSRQVRLSFLTGAG
ncbi:secondary thiamine-phosphate synthase enzyme YjbQ [Streptomonospora algeriensis]|uniref:Secondary thiamine-phosphate synthase enzyme YjbQ n=1 Tax=Streptomonospora algeriensis TaxID=995084 RepID=A0ABW3BDP7_9ACTN